MVALSNVECYRLDKAAFHGLLHERPELALQFAAVLARRRVDLEAAKEGLDAEARRQRLDSHSIDLVGSIRRFFGLPAE